MLAIETSREWRKNKWGRKKVVGRGRAKAAAREDKWKCKSFRDEKMNGVQTETT